jgi:hypothetical protein
MATVSLRRFATQLKQVVGSFLTWFAYEKQEWVKLYPPVILYVFMEFIRKALSFLHSQKTLRFSYKNGPLNIVEDNNQY